MSKIKEIFFINGKFNQEKVNKYLNEFQSETDRAAAILGGAYLDNLLNELLKCRLLYNSLTDKDLNNLSFDRRIKLCYSTGVINQKEKRDLTTIKNIRNYFAHDIEVNDFKKGNIPYLCKKLYSQEDSILAEGSPAANSRNIFTESVAILMSNLQDRILNCERLNKIKGI